MDGGRGGAFGRAAGRRRPHSAGHRPVFAADARGRGGDPPGGAEAAAGVDRGGQAEAGPAVVQVLARGDGDRRGSGSGQLCGGEAILGSAAAGGGCGRRRRGRRSCWARPWRRGSRFRFCCASGRRAGRCWRKALAELGVEEVLAAVSDADHAPAWASSRQVSRSACAAPGGPGSDDCGHRREARFTRSSSPGRRRSGRRWDRRLGWRPIGAWSASAPAC